MSHKSGAPAIQPKGLACLHSLLNDAHSSASAAQNKAVQRRQHLCLAFRFNAYMNSTNTVLASRLQTDVKVAP